MRNEHAVHISSGRFIWLSLYAMYTLTIRLQPEADNLSHRVLCASWSKLNYACCSLEWHVEASLYALCDTQPDSPENQLGQFQMRLLAQGNHSMCEFCSYKPHAYAWLSLSMLYFGVWLVML